MKQNAPQNQKPRKSRRRPRVLVLEALSGARSCVQAQGGDVLEIRPTDVKRADQVMSEPWDALLLTGGVDVDPRLYGEKPHREVYGVSETRDLVETVALAEARKRNVPVLGICRGHQMINVEAGGTLYQHIRGHRGGNHILLTREGSVLREICPMDNKYVVSLHHQSVKDVAPGFICSGIAKDKTCEAIESLDGRSLGVQFHPEMARNSAYSKAIFRWLVVAAAERAGLAKPAVPEPRLERVLDRGPTDYGQLAWTDEELDSIVQVAKKPGKHRKAGAKTRPKRPMERTEIRRSWICPRCGIIFDSLKDREDHVHLLHK
jgi:putative glutamine amidotransferase